MILLNINGPINAGKTTVSKLLAEKLPDSLFIEVDSLLSEEEAKQLGLSMSDAWQESVNRLERLIFQGVKGFQKRPENAPKIHAFSEAREREIIRGVPWQKKRILNWNR